MSVNGLVHHLTNLRFTYSNFFRNKIIKAASSLFIQNKNKMTPKIINFNICLSKTKLTYYYYYMVLESDYYFYHYLNNNELSKTR